VTTIDPKPAVVVGPIGSRTDNAPTDGNLHRGLQRNSAVLAPGRWRYRLVAAVVAGACVTLLSLAAWITPEPGGVGSHQQFHLPACGFYVRTGYPCPTCGMTTAFALAVRGRLLQAFATQPAGALAAIATVLVGLTGGYVSLTGRRLDRLTTRINWTIVAVAAGATVLAAWLWLCLQTWLWAH